MNDEQFLALMRARQRIADIERDSAEANEALVKKALAAAREALVTENPPPLPWRVSGGAEEPRTSEKAVSVSGSPRSRSAQASASPQRQRFRLSTRLVLACLALFAAIAAVVVVVNSVPDERKMATQPSTDRKLPSEQRSISPDHGTQVHPVLAWSGLWLRDSARGAVKLDPKVAVSIGNNSGWPERELPPIYGPGNDATDMAGVFKKSDYDSVGLLTDGDTKPENRPTLANLRQYLPLLVSRIAENGSLTLYWAGHGIEHNGKAAFVTAPEPGGQPEVWTLDDFSKALGARKDITVILVVDACRNVSAESSRAFLSKLRESAGNYVLVTSCKPGQLARETQPAAGKELDSEDTAWHGAFTRELLRARYGRWNAEREKSVAAADQDNDDFLSWNEAVNAAASPVAVAASVRESSRDGDPAQEPEYHIGGRPDLNRHRGVKEAIRVQHAPKPPAAAVTATTPAPDQIIREIPVERVGGEEQFVIYQNYTTDRLRFAPSGWMWEGKNGENEDERPMVARLMKMTRRSFQTPKSPAHCIRWDILRWTDPESETSTSQPRIDVSWLGIAWISQSDPDGKQWWAAAGDNRGIYYDLSRFKSLRFAARFEVNHPDPAVKASLKQLRLTAKVAPLARNKEGTRLKDLGNELGDSRDMIQANYALDGRWAEFSLDITPKTAADGDLSRICSIAFVLNRQDQREFPADASRIPPVTIYLDDVYFSTQPATQTTK